MLFLLDPKNNFTESFSSGTKASDWSKNLQGNLISINPSFHILEIVVFDPKPEKHKPVKNQSERTDFRFLQSA